VAINYNLPSLNDAHLKIDGPTLAAIYTGAVLAQHGTGFLARCRAGVEKNVVPHSSRKNRELCSRDVRGKILSAGGDRNILIVGAGDDFHGNGNFCESIGRKRGAECRRQRKHRAHAKVAKRVTGVAQGFLKIRVGLGQLIELIH